jgi:hypothetical protein
LPYFARLRRAPRPPRVVIEPTPELEPVEPEAIPEPPDFSDLTKAELIAEAEDRGLDTSGNKPDIIERLEASDG